MKTENDESFKTSSTREKLSNFLSFLHSNLNPNGSEVLECLKEETLGPAEVPETQIKLETEARSSRKRRKLPKRPQRKPKDEPEVKLEQKEAFECQICSQEFDSRSLLKSHERVCHKKSLCDVCGVLVPPKYAKMHRKKHVEDRPFQCEKCSKSFKDKPNLSRHLQMCHQAPVFFVCDYCNKALKCKKALRKHLHQYHVPEKALRCEECQRPFGDRARLTRHYLVHKRARNEIIEAPKDFECLECRKKFATNTHLKQHMGVHTKEKKFVCSFCPQGFNFFSSKRNHERNVHGKAKKQPEKLEVAAYTEIHSETILMEVLDPAIQTFKVVPFSPSSFIMAQPVRVVETRTSF